MRSGYNFLSKMTWKIIEYLNPCTLIFVWKHFSLNLSLSTEHSATTAELIRQPGREPLGSFGWFFREQGSRQKGCLSQSDRILWLYPRTRPWFYCFYFKAHSFCMTSEYESWFLSQWPINNNHWHFVGDFCEVNFMNFRTLQ